VTPGGRLVYCTCSLEPEEGERQAEAFLAAHGDFRLDPIGPEEVGGLPELVTPEGYLRTLPSHWPLGDQARREDPDPAQVSRDQESGRDGKPDPARVPGSGEGARGGLDGFFAARFVRQA
jgi:16S rRNA C967 or C1407 C5-methylase (RsmB/RsmF family)